MKKALFKLLLFLLLFCLTDGLAGSLFAYMQSHAPSYSPGYIAHHASEDVVVFGSSKGGNNYNMKFLNDSSIPFFFIISDKLQPEDVEYEAKHPGYEAKLQEFNQAIVDMCRSQSISVLNETTPHAEVAEKIRELTRQ